MDDENERPGEIYRVEDDGSGDEEVVFFDSKEDVAQHVEFDNLDNGEAIVDVYTFSHRVRVKRTIAFIPE